MESTIAIKVRGYGDKILQMMEKLRNARFELAENYEKELLADAISNLEVRKLGRKGIKQEVKEWESALQLAKLIIDHNAEIQIG